MNIDANLYVHRKNAQSAQRKDNVTCKSDCDFVLYSGSIDKLEATLVGFTLSKRNTDKSKNIAIKEIKTSRDSLVLRQVNKENTKYIWRSCIAQECRTKNQDNDVILFQVFNYFKKRKNRV